MPLKKGQASEAWKQGKMAKYNLRNRTPEERHAIAVKGGQANKERLAKKKALKEQLQSLLELDIKDKKKTEELRKLGIDPEDMNNQMLMLVTLFKKGALLGDVPAIKQICDIINNNYGEIASTQFQPPTINIISTSPNSVKINGNIEADEDEEDW